MRHRNKTVEIKVFLNFLISKNLIFKTEDNVPAESYKKKNKEKKLYFLHP